MNPITLDLFIEYIPNPFLELPQMWILFPKNMKPMYVLHNFPITYLEHILATQIVQ
jgi:hypothetical protein